ncbi:MAG: RluA family pseudouridine synthase [Fusobacteriota bacterium]
MTLIKKIKIVKDYSGMKVKKYLKDIEFYSSRSLRKNNLKINNKECSLNARLNENDILTIEEPIAKTDIEPIDMELNIIEETEDLILINKPPNIITHPSKKKGAITLANGIVNYYKEKYGRVEFPRFYNRLDMDTSGIIVVAKTAYGQAFLQNHGKVKKYYKAIVEGVIKKDEFCIKKNIIRRKGQLKSEISENEGKKAKTKVRVIKRNLEKKISLIELELFTGRTHQIRVHLSSIGHPILGDTLYGKGQKAKRQLLHSYKIKYIDPYMKKRVRKSIKSPKDMLIL